MPRSSSSPLADMQSLMARAVMRPLTRGEDMQTVWEDGSPTADVASGFVKPNDRLTSFDRLQIYNQQYWWRLLASFGDDFRGLRAVLGEERFEKVAVAYLEHCGSQSWTLRDLGIHLESFLRERPALTAPQSALAIDMVRVEWARVVAFDGPELPPIQPAKIRNIPASQLRLGLQPYLTLLALDYPIDELLAKLRRKSNIETGSASNAVSAARPRARRRLTARASNEPVYLAVHRVELSVFYKRLEPAAYRILAALRSGTALENACADAFTESDEPDEANAVKLQNWFEDWMKFGWFTKPEAL